MATIKDRLNQIKQQLTESGSRPKGEAVETDKTKIEELTEAAELKPVQPPVISGLTFRVREKPIMCYHIYDPKYPQTKFDYPDCLYEMLANEEYTPAIGSKAVIYEYKLYIGRPHRWEPQTVYERRLDGWSLVESKVKV